MGLERRVRRASPIGLSVAVVALACGRLDFDDRSPCNDITLLTDDFEGGVDVRRWETSVSPGTSYSQDGGALTFQLAVNVAGSWVGALSTYHYDLRGRSRCRTRRPPPTRRSRSPTTSIAPGSRTRAPSASTI